MRHTYDPPWDAAAPPLCALPAIAGVAMALTRRGKRFRRDVADTVQALQRDDADARPPASGFGMEGVLEQARQRLERVEDARRTCSEERRELNLKVRVLDNQRRHVEAILNVLGDAVLVTDAFQELVIATTDAAALLLGFDLESSLHKPIDEVLDAPALTKMILDTQEARETHVRRSVEHRLRVDGDSRFYRSPSAGSAVGSAVGSAAHARARNTAEAGTTRALPPPATPLPPTAAGVPRPASAAAAAAWS